MRLAALILTGGRSERMGSPKEFLPFAGETLLERTVRTLRGGAAPVVVVRRAAAQPLPPLPAAVQVIADEQPGFGPLAAIATGLRHLGATASDAEAVFVTGCDSPFVTVEAARFLAGRLGGADVVMPVHEGFPQPLCAVYRPAALAVLNELLARGERSPRALFGLSSTRRLATAELQGFDPELRFLRNINTPEQYREACRLADEAATGPDYGR